MTLPLTQSQVTRFWKYAAPRRDDECWPWQGELDGDGYGRFPIRGRYTGAHRVALRVVTGSTGEGQMALHSCDNPPCVNPAHLRFGTHAENMEDMRARGRAIDQVGASNIKAKLTEEQVVEMRKMMRSGVRNRELKVIFNVADSTLSSIRHGVTWKHLLEVAA